MCNKAGSPLALVQSNRSKRSIRFVSFGAPLPHGAARATSQPYQHYPSVRPAAIMQLQAVTFGCRVRCKVWVLFLGVAKNRAIPLPPLSRDPRRSCVCVGGGHVCTFIWEVGNWKVVSIYGLRSQRAGVGARSGAWFWSNWARRHRIWVYNRRLLIPGGV